MCAAIDGQLLSGYVIAIVFAFLTIFYFTVHKWTPATCTEPETCTICGKVRTPATGHSWLAATCTEPQKCAACGITGNDAALGHSWTAATCTEPEKCTVCGTTRGKELGHNWKEATYEEPKTCSRCGKQEGNKKGYYGSAKGYYSEEWASMPSFTNWLIHPYVLYQKIGNCRNLDFTLSFSYSYGNPFGEWEFFVRDDNGNWISFGIYDIQDTETTVHAHFDQPITVTAFGVDRRSYDSCDTYLSYTVSNVQQYVEQNL